jgi:hypothetical protein
MKGVMLTQRDLVAGGAGVGVLGWRLCGRLLEARHRTFPVVQRTTACHVDGVTALACGRASRVRMPQDVVGTRGLW